MTGNEFIKSDAVGGLTRVKSSTGAPGWRGELMGQVLWTRTEAFEPDFPRKRRPTLSFIGEDGEPRRQFLESVSVRDVLDGFPVREPHQHRGLGNMLGKRWVSKAGGLIPTESINESNYLISADFDPNVIRIAAQPFRFRFSRPGVRPHVPDFLTLRSDGTVRVVNVRDVDNFNAEDEARMNEFAWALSGIGWEHAMWHPLPPVVAENLSWLSRMGVPDTAQPTALRAAAGMWDGDTYGSLERKMLSIVPAPFIRPAIDQLIWTHYFDINLDSNLDTDSILWRPGP